MLSRAILIHKEICLKIKIFVWLRASLLFLLPVATVLENLSFPQSLWLVSGFLSQAFNVSQDIWKESVMLCRMCWRDNLSLAFCCHLWTFWGCGPFPTHVMIASYLFSHLRDIFSVITIHAIIVWGKRNSCLHGLSRYFLAGWFFLFIHNYGDVSDI